MLGICFIDLKETSFFVFHLVLWVTEKISAESLYFHWPKEQNGIHGDSNIDPVYDMSCGRFLCMMM